MKTVHLILFFLVGSILVSAQTAGSKYKVVNKIHLSGDTGWDYLYSDDQAGRLYVSHGSIVQIINENKGELVGTISGMKGVHGIAIASGLSKGFISSGRDTLVTVFDTKTLKTIDKIIVTGLNPDAILYDSFSKKVFVFNGKTKNATVIDAVTDKVIATIPLEGKPEFSVSDDEGKVFVNLEDVSKICAINSTTLKVEHVWPLSPGEEPSGLAIDKENHLLFSVCGNKKMTVTNAENGKIIATVPIGEDVDGTAFDSKLKCAYSANGEGNLTVVKEENNTHFKVLATIPTKKSARTIAVNTITHHIYLPAADFEPTPKTESDNSKVRPKIIPNSFVILDIKPDN